MDERTPPKMDPETYHKSAHCLRFSDVWYNIYELMETSVIDQPYFVKIYERVTTQPKSAWKQRIEQTYKIDFIKKVRNLFNSNSLSRDQVRSAFDYMKLFFSNYSRLLMYT